MGDKEEIAVFKQCMGMSTGFDANGDGKVSSEEAACGKIVDKNHNGQIDPIETKAFVACLKGAQNGYDFNGDGKVSANELRCGLEADSNHNGKIDKGEIAAFKKCLNENKPAPMPPKQDVGVPNYEIQFAKLFDMNNDGKLDHDELRRAKLAWAIAKLQFGSSVSAKTSYYDDYLRANKRAQSARSNSGYTRQHNVVHSKWSHQ